MFTPCARRRSCPCPPTANHPNLDCTLLIIVNKMFSKTEILIKKLVNSRRMRIYTEKVWTHKAKIEDVGRCEKM